MSHPAMTIAGAPVFINDNPESCVSWLLREFRPSSIHVLCDENTLRYCWPVIKEHFGQPIVPIVIPAGEVSKQVATCTAVWKSLSEQGADRKSLLVCLGGGVVTDLGGFCAATYIRGMRFVYLPTTLLGMCDAALGGKLGVDLDALKNYVGLIQQPDAVWMNPTFLKTLPDEQITNGMAEVVKHAIIGDAALFQWLEEKETRDRGADWERLLLRAASVKKQFVEADVRESGVRAVLNFGHTIGHAIESLGLVGRRGYLHGDCVATGMIAETWLAYVRRGVPDKETCDRIVSVINKWTNPLRITELSLVKLMPFLLHDKKNTQHLIAFALPDGIGHATPGHMFTAEALAELCQRPEMRQYVPWLQE